jgi:hypothetical protein
MKVQSNPLAHKLSDDISKRGVLEALKQDASACYAVSGQLESKPQVLFPACNILGDRQIVRFQAQAHGLPRALALYGEAAIRDKRRRDRRRDHGLTG